MKDSCHNCSNAVGSDWCTMQKDMELAKYKKCPFHKILPQKPKSEPIPETREPTNVVEEYYSSDFRRFVKKGGFFSVRTGRYAPE